MVRQHPKDVQLWLRFAAFQMEFLPLQRRPNLLPVLEKQSAILSRALSVCGDDVVLIDRYMAVAEMRFDTDATIALWSSVSQCSERRYSKPFRRDSTLYLQVLEKFAGSATLWLRFISYIKGAQSRFSVSKVRATYATAIKRTLSGGGGIVSSDSVSKAEQGALLIFRHLVEFERCSGYTERALSLWQALLELCLFCPPAPPGPSTGVFITASSWCIVHSVSAYIFVRCNKKGPRALILGLWSSEIGRRRACGVSVVPPMLYAFSAYSALAFVKNGWPLLLCSSNRKRMLPLKQTGLTLLRVV